MVVIISHYFMCQYFGRDQLDEFILPYVMSTGAAGFDLEGPGKVSLAPLTSWWDDWKAVLSWAAGPLQNSQGRSMCSF